MQGYIREFLIKYLSPKSCELICILDCGVWKKSGKIRMCVGHFTHTFLNTLKQIHVLYPKFEVLEICLADSGFED